MNETFKIGDAVEFTRDYLDRVCIPGVDDDPHPFLWGTVIDVREGPRGGIIRWKHQRGESTTLGMWLCPVGTTSRERLKTK